MQYPSPQTLEHNGVQKSNRLPFFHSCSKAVLQPCLQNIRMEKWTASTDMRNPRQDKCRESSRVFGHNWKLVFLNSTFLHIPLIKTLSNFYILHKKRNFWAGNILHVILHCLALDTAKWWNSMKMQANLGIFSSAGNSSLMIFIAGFFCLEFHIVWHLLLQKCKVAKVCFCWNGNPSTQPTWCVFNTKQDKQYLWILTSFIIKHLLFSSLVSFVLHWSKT